MTFIPGDIMSLPSQLFDSERPFLKGLAMKVSEEFESPTVVNIGIWLGASCYSLRIGAPDAQLIGIDVMGTYAIELKHPALLKHLRMRVIKRNSNFVPWNDAIHLLFIDGGHELQVVENDYIIYGTCVVPKGYMVFHDSDREEVKDVVNSIRSKKLLWEEICSGAEKVGSLAVFRRL